jgi:hypothetical protein
MQHSVYRSADRPNLFLGIRGRLVTYLVGGAAASVFLGILVGSCLVDILGIVVAAAGVLGTYFALLHVQGLMSDKEVGKALVSRKFQRSFVAAPRARLFRYWDGKGKLPVPLSDMDVE